MKNNPQANQDLLNRLWQAFQLEGVAGVLKCLKPWSQGRAGADTAQIQALHRLALRVRKVHPGAALQLVELVLQRAPDHVPGLLLAASLHFRTGNRGQMADLARQVLQQPVARPEQCLHALGLLSREALDAPMLQAAKQAFDSCGRPNKMLDTVLDMALRTADWDYADQLIAQLRQARVQGHPQALHRSARTHLLWCDDEADNLAVIAHSVSNLVGAVPQAVLQPRPQPLAGRRLRVAYLSSDYREHPTSRLLLGLLRHHDARQFELFLYCSGWDDGSSLRQALVKGVTHFVCLQGLSDAEAAARMRADGIDVLVELNGPTHGTRMSILSHRPAPVQIEYLGWPGSVGGQLADYVVADDYTVPPEREALYPEKLIRLDRVYQINDYAAATKAAPPPRALFGLPEGCMVLGSFNHINKVRNEVWRVWMQIMRAVPDAVLWMLDQGPLVREHVLAAARREGVAPERLIFAPRCAQGQHLSRLQHCDLMLDPWPYGGHTTTSDALFAGVPVVALEGRNFASRVSGALLRAAGLEALVQPDVDQYVARAVQLLTDKPLRQALRAFLRQEVPRSDVFNARDKTRQFEAAYRRAFELALAGKPAEPMHLKPRQPKPQAVFRWPVVGVPGADALFQMTSWQPAEKPATAAPMSEAAPTPVGAMRLPLVLVCGPWSSGSSAVAGLLAKAGLQAPGPYVKVNDPRTTATFEMQAFRQVLNSLASEQTLQRTVPADQALQALKHFRDVCLLPAVRSGQGSAPAMLKHGLAMLFLDELAALFDLRIVGVLRPLQAIEATRMRRGWHAGLGQRGAQVLYQALFAHVVSAATPFHLLRYPELISQPGAEIDALLAFCGVSPTVQQRDDALGFIRQG